MVTKYINSEMAKAGYKSRIFHSSFKGGKCGLSGLKICAGDEVAYFRDKGLCHAASIEKTIFAERIAAQPKCACGAASAPGLDQCQECIIRFAEADRIDEELAYEFNRCPAEFIPAHVA